MTAPISNGSMPDRFKAYLRDGHFLADTPALAPLTLALYRRLAAGSPIRREDLARDIGVSPETAGALLAALPASTIDFGAGGEIVAFGGLSLVPANHDFQVGDLTLHTWCVFDALFLPQIIRQPAVLRTRCPSSGSPVEIGIGPESVAWSRPDAPVMSIVAPESAACRDDLRGSFCNHVNFFVDRMAFRRWSADRPDVGHVSLHDAYDLALRRNFYRYGNALSAHSGHAANQPGDIA